jgi:hypothetical protein
MRFGQNERQRAGGSESFSIPIKEKQAYGI